MPLPCGWRSLLPSLARFKRIANNEKKNFFFSNALTSKRATVIIWILKLSGPVPRLDLQKQWENCTHKPLRNRISSLFCVFYSEKAFTFQANGSESAIVFVVYRRTTWISRLLLFFKWYNIPGKKFARHVSKFVLCQCNLIYMHTVRSFLTSPKKKVSVDCFDGGLRSCHFQLTTRFSFTQPYTNSAPLTRSLARSRSKRTEHENHHHPVECTGIKCVLALNWLATNMQLYRRKFARILKQQEQKHSSVHTNTIVSQELPLIWIWDAENIHKFSVIFWISQAKHILVNSFSFRLHLSADSTVFRLDFHRVPIRYDEIYQQTERAGGRLREREREIGQKCMRIIQYCFWAEWRQSISWLRLIEW